MHLPYGGGYAGRAQLSCNTFESHPDLTNLFAARKGQVAVSLTVPLWGIGTSKSAVHELGQSL